ncbi:aldose 1-epimerase family protein [Cutibacterium sp.]|uniref:aldose 1-epimerase family protein n=1 Tax=Cutibacterium sp. TaxID=1912221 RepID=UPI0026DABEB4|nr:aldose 1-epimerase family protein [Cutibacterium sp.]MDO4411824.1 aldose 1-epimerase family protein [Cutibacterium sp.]
MIDDVILPTGTQYEISHGPWQAVVTEQGATLRRLRYQGDDVIKTFDADQAPIASQGQQLLPWPNRIRDGHYSFNGVDQQLAISEVDRNNAIHGLAAWVPWSLVEHSESSVTQEVRIMSQPGWPGTIDVWLTHSLDDHGLTVTVKARNVGATEVPFGYAAHPYFCLGGSIDEWQVEAPFASWLQVDDRLLPVQMRDMDEVHTLNGQPVNGRTFDTAYTLDGGKSVGEPAWRVKVTAGQRSHELWGDSTMGWVQIYTPDDRLSLAVEPMTCGPNAFNEGPTHNDVIRLASGDEVVLTWGIC